MNHRGSSGPRPIPTSAKRTRSRLIRTGAIGAGVLLLTASLASNSIDETIASWEDREVLSATMTAQSVAPVTGYKCTNNSVILGLFKSVTLSWVGVEVAPGSSYKIAMTNRAGLSRTIVQSASSISINDNLLNDLLGALLTKSDTLSVNVAAKLPGNEGWESAPSVDLKVDYAPFLLGLGGFTCG